MTRPHSMHADGLEDARKLCGVPPPNFKATLSETYPAHTWKERYVKALGEVITENVYGDPFKAWDLIYNLTETTPPDFKEKGRSFLVTARKVYDKQWKFKYPSERIHAQAFVKRKIVPFLLDKFSTLLYEDILQDAKKSKKCRARV